MGRLGTSGGGRLKTASTNLTNFTPQQLEQFAKKRGIEPPKEKKTVSALRKVGGVLSTGSAFTSGLVSGALDPNRGAFEVASERAGKAFRGEEIKGFSDTIREQVGQPETRLGKIAVGTAGFIADVLFDPLTYLTFGAGSGLKVGGKALTKGGTKLFQKTATEAAEKVGQKAVGRTSRIFAEATGKKGLTQEGIERAVKEGFERGKVQEIAGLGRTLLDKGGVKLFGKTLVSSERLAQTPIGKIARRLGESEISQALKNTLGKTFISDFKKDPRLIAIIDKGGRQIREATEGIVKANEKLFSGLSDTQMSELFNTIFEKKLQIAKSSDEVAGVFGDLSKEQLKKETGLSVVFRKGIPTKKATTEIASQLRTEAKAVQKGERLLFEDPKLQKVADALFEGKDAIVPRFAKLAGLPDDEAIKFYIPSKFQDKLDLKDVLMGRNLSSPRLGFLKKFTGVQDNLIRDPFEAYSRGQVEVVASRIKTDAANTVINSLGKPLKELTEKEAKKLGYVKWSRKGLGGEGAQKIEGWLPKGVADELNKFIEPPIRTVNELAKATGFDYATGLFKSYVTSLFPGFHIRNVTSNQFQNMMKIGIDVANPSLQKMGLDAALGRNLNRVIKSKTGKVTTLGKIIKEIRKHSDILDQGQFGRLEQLLEEGKANITRTRNLQRFNPFSRENIALQKGREFGSLAERQAKLVSVLSAVLQGKSVKEGIKQAEEALFNYSKLAPFEKDVMRRVIPFYTFARKNFELQLKMLSTNPGKTAGLIKAFKGAGEAIGEPMTQEDLDGLPSFVLDNLGIKAGAYADNRFGQATYLSGFGLPIEEFLTRFSGDKGFLTNALKSTFAQLNPILKFPSERATGVDFFQGKPITEITNATSLVGVLDSMPEPVAKELKELIAFKEVEKARYEGGKKVGTKKAYYADPFALHLLRNLPTARFQTTGGFLADPEQSALAKAARFFTGVKGWSIDVEEQKFYKEFERKKQLQKFLADMGLIGIKDIIYPK